jgi:hypothetical protein
MVMPPSPETFEKLGAFYLGRQFELAGSRVRDELVLYDAKDLTTHALCVGMTGSGKTGLCLALLEEAAIDGIPALCIDPKGDLGNLLLAFPGLQPNDFQPWVDSGEATRKGVSVEQLAADTATKWREGLASWGQSPDRIERYLRAVDLSIYTPGSSSGLPLTVLKSFDAPPASMIDDADAMRERVTAAASGLLSLLGIDADPLSSREHILLSSILDTNWRRGKGVDMAQLIAQIQSPPMQRVGVLDIDSFMPVADRSALAMRLNNLLASPAFSTWLDGEPLSIQSLLYTPQGKPRLTIVSIAHLSDSERMFFVTILLNELVAWMRTQSGTSSLRALFYMDEVFGYFPPSAKPPSKPPMLTLLKQARAFGLGVVLATQNPVDLDYKGLSNIGTWFLGRLQTERDKLRVLEGLEGAAIQQGAKFDRQKMEQTLAALGNRVFLMNNVHEDQPIVFQSRWALSFLRGPLARDQIATLMQPRKLAAAANAANAASGSSGAGNAGAGNAGASGVASTGTNASKFAIGKSETGGAPIVPASIAQRFAVAAKRPAADSKLVYYPALLGQASLHFVRAASKVDAWVDARQIVSMRGEVPLEVWENSEPLDGSVELSQEGEEGYQYAALPAAALNADRYSSWGKQLKEYLYRHQSLTIYRSPALDTCAPVGSDEAQARIALTQAAREARDAAKAKLEGAMIKKAEAIEKKMRTASEKLAREQSQLESAKYQSIVNLGSSLLGALVGRKLASRSNIGKVSTAIRSAGRTAQEKGDVTRAEETLTELQQQMEQLNADLEQQVAELSQQYDVENLQLEPIAIPPRKGDLKTDEPVLLWVPYQLDNQGRAERLV